MGGKAGSSIAFSEDHELSIDGNYMYVPKEFMILIRKMNYFIVAK